MDRIVSLVGEGRTDIVVLKRLLVETDLTPGKVYVTDGKDALDQSLPGYNKAAYFSNWLVLRDLDHDAACAPELRRKLLSEPAPNLRLHVAVRAVESWLLADREAVARFLGVPQGKVTMNPEALDNPKGHVLALARRSRRKAIREALLPAEGTSARVGPGDATALMEFTNQHWRPEAAQARSPSLARLRVFLKRLSQRGMDGC